jgi:hypothetical protein
MGTLQFICHEGLQTYNYTRDGSGALEGGAGMRVITHSPGLQCRITVTALPHIKRCRRLLFPLRDSLKVGRMRRMQSEIDWKAYIESACLLKELPDGMLDLQAGHLA